MLKQIGLVITAMGVWLMSPMLVNAQTLSRPTIDVKINVFRDRNFDNLLNLTREPILHGWNIETYDAQANRLPFSAQHSTQWPDHTYTIDASSAYLCVEPVFNWVQTLPFQSAFEHPDNDAWFCYTIDDSVDVYNFAVYEIGQPADDGRNIDNQAPTLLPPVITPAPTDPADTSDTSGSPADTANPDPVDNSDQTNEPDPQNDPDPSTDPDDSQQSNDQASSNDTSSDTGGQVLGTANEGDTNTNDQGGEVLAEGDTLAETGVAILLVMLTGGGIIALALTTRGTSRLAYLLYRR